MLRVGRLLLAGGFALLVPVAARAQDVVVYDDQLENGFNGDYSYGGGTNFANTLPVHSGTKSISFAGNAFNAVSLAAPNSTFTAAQYPNLHFYVNGGPNGGQQLRIHLQIIVGTSSSELGNAPLANYISGGSILANQWTEVTVPLNTLSMSAFNRIDLQSDVGGTQSVLYIDDVSLLGPSGNPTPTMTITHDVFVSTLKGDQFAWHDSAGNPRVAVLAQNNGGALIQFQYQMPDSSTRIAGVTNYGNGANGGFGYVVSHRYEGTTGISGDDSPLGFGFSGTFTRVFEGRHHALFQFTQLYPRHSSTTASPPNTTYNVPVTINWMLSTGRDNPVWALTWDLSGVPANSLIDDSRAPYGELFFDGSTSAETQSEIAGVSWGDRYKFFSTTNPVTMNSAWTWNVANTIPYVKLWTTAVDATMGTVQTQTIVQQDAGGYYGTSRWNTTSATAPGDACAAGGEYGGSAAHVMPCSYNWPYQSINYSMGAAIGGSDNEGTNNSRLAWGANFGFLGQTQYYINGSAYYGGPLPNTTASGYPKRSYSTYVVLGPHSTSPVEAQVTQVETIQSLTLSTLIGGVATSGPAGIARADNVTYAPAGYNQIYGALAFTATVNQLDANVAVGSGTLKKPLLILGNYTSASYPPTVKLNGLALTEDVDYFASLRGSPNNELWMTLNRDLTGATNHLEILSTACTPVPATPVITAPASATAGQTGLTASVTNDAGSTWAWSITNGTITAGNGTNQITFTAGGAGTLGLSVVETNNSGCSSAAGTAAVNVTATPPSGFAFHPLTPCRLFDTRNATGAAAAAPALAGSSTRTFAIAGRCALPSTARSLSVNVTITGPAAPGSLLLYPADLASAPVANSISFHAGMTRANNDLLLLAGDGTGFDVQNSSTGAVHFILDVNGWFE